eukprot:TRINITY_DN90_c1_g1_i8.p2 TRINITY_DN90_c1_g1~~TRINITY_DN90_c1_g1_i8.p2  ORF type:complete len:114 (+),score=17.40 TRINITY_DN90_c1_g1_i8:1405-1746(+)
MTRNRKKKVERERKRKLNNNSYKKPTFDKLRTSQPVLDVGITLFPLSSFEAMAILAVDVAHQGKTVTSCVECESKSITYSMELGNYGVQFFCGDLIQRRNVNFHTLVVFLMIL